MTDFIRFLVSGDKARFKDGELDVDLDLVYITDRVIVMGYPAAGIEGLYRNRREDARKFLEHRHGKNFWVFNFCPVKENSYPSSVFNGRVSRYPFPDHHAPPLAMLALVAREMHAWLDGSPERVAVLHCKAGQGRSGTMACSYLLTLTNTAQPEAPKDSNFGKALATTRAEEVMNAMPADEQLSEDCPVESIMIGEDPIKKELVKSSAENAQCANEPAANLTQVLKLHTSRRMKPDSSKKPKQGVSIPSQRRWLYYWSLLLAHEGPPGFWSAHGSPQTRLVPRVRLTQIKLRMSELSGTKTNLIRVANAILDRTTATARGVGISGGRPRVWASLARYDDEFVGHIEDWEKYTRDDSENMGKRRLDTDYRAADTFADALKERKWDSAKMIKSFARLGTVGNGVVQKGEAQTDGKTVTQLLQPLTNDSWGVLRDEIEESPGSAHTEGSKLESEETSLYDVPSSSRSGGGILLDAQREVRVKLFMGQVFMAWFWFIPAFHMPQPQSGGQDARMLLSKKEIDFPLGIGSSIVDVEVAMEWYPEIAEAITPPLLQGNVRSVHGRSEPSGITGTSTASTRGGRH
ncbi:hypothetical protein BKA93DRAFT_739805 [Sparassis latifolia]